MQSVPGPYAPEAELSAPRLTPLCTLPGEMCCFDKQWASHSLMRAPRLPQCGEQALSITGCRSPRDRVQSGQD